MAYRGAEIAREREYGNFRPEPDLRPKWVQKLERRREKLARVEGNCAEHLALIRRLPCTSCGTRVGVHAHHLRTGPAADKRALGRRAPDEFAVPLCWLCHEALHAVPSSEEPGWFARKGWQIFAYQRALWANSGSYRSMLMVYEAHRDDAYKCRLERIKHRPREMRPW